jgi:hypothetical protein
MSARCTSLTKTAVSLSWLIWRNNAVISDPTGLVIPAWNKGFCRKMPASSVDPDRGNPEMK